MGSKTPITHALSRRPRHSARVRGYMQIRHRGLTSSWLAAPKTNVSKLCSDKRPSTGAPA